MFDKNIGDFNFNLIINPDKEGLQKSINITITNKNTFNYFL